jgi:hypothetical protein
VLGGCLRGHRWVVWGAFFFFFFFFVHISYFLCHFLFFSLLPKRTHRPHTAHTQSAHWHRAFFPAGRDVYGRRAAPALTRARARRRDASLCRSDSARHAGRPGRRARTLSTPTRFVPLLSLLQEKKKKRNYTPSPHHPAKWGKARSGESKNINHLHFFFFFFFIPIRVHFPLQAVLFFFSKKKPPASLPLTWRTCQRCGARRRAP